ncbi:MAG: M48 family metalloprotease [Phycisphaerales bacterium]
MKCIRSAIVIAATTALIAGSGCSRNEATGRLQFDQLTTKQEIALGAQAMPELIEQYGGESDDRVLREYVERVGSKLAEYTEGENPQLPWEFTLLDSDVINAFALPGGKVFMSRGLMAKMTNEAQLAGVLGHEIGHVTAEHIDERISQATLASYGVELTQMLAGSGEGALAQVVPVVVGVGGQGFLLKFSRDQESEADWLGMRYMRRAGYDPIGQLQVMRILDEASQGSSAPEILSTHPLPSTRIENVQELLDTTFKNSQNDPDLGLYEERFERVVGGRLSAIPVGPDSFALWCGVCREQAHDSQ